MPRSFAGTVASLAAVVASLIVWPAPAGATGVVPCSDLDEWEAYKACVAAYDTDGDGWVFPQIEAAWPGESLAWGTAAVVTFSAVDLYEPAVVTIAERETGASLGTVTLSPAVPTASFTIPVTRSGQHEVTARSRGLRLYFDDTTDFTVAPAPSTASVDLPPARMVPVGAKPDHANGRVSGGTRPIHLQVKGRRGTWATIAETTSNAAGAFSVPVPTFWVGSHTYRVFAPEHASQAAVVAGGSSTIEVNRNYRPQGKASSNTLLAPPGVRWNPCQPLTYRLNPAGMPKRGRADALFALKEVSAATGLRFTYAGTTTSVPFSKKDGGPNPNPDGTDIVIAWSTPKVVPGLIGWTAGIGGQSYNSWEMSNGGVVLDRAQRLTKGQWREIMLHEVGHAIGLGHVGDRKQIMRSGARGDLTRYGKGDLAGLAKLGARDGCIDAPEGISYRDPADPDTAASVRVIPAGQTRWSIQP